MQHAELVASCQMAENREADGARLDKPCGMCYHAGKLKGADVKKFLMLLAVPLLALRADVVKQTVSSMKMAGGMIDWEQSTLTEIRADRKVDEDLTKMKVTILSGKPQHKGQITRLDKGKYWQLDHDAKTWRELEIKMPEYKGQVEVKAEGSGQVPTRYKVARSEFKVTKMANKLDINGFSCTGYEINWTLVIEEIATRKQSTSIMTTVYWVTDTTPTINQAEAEEAAFNRALMAKLNANVIPDKARMMGAEYLIALGISQAELSENMLKAAEEMSKIQGYPIVTSVAWKVPSGDTTASGEKAPPKPSGLAIPSARNLLGAALEKKIEEKLPLPRATNDGLMFSSRLEVKSLKVEPVKDSDFEIPEGYKKVD
jgi:hypothetical protein